MRLHPVVRAGLLAASALPAAWLLLAALAPTDWWPAQLASHWAPQAAILCLPLWCWLGRRPWPGAAILVLNAAALWPWLVAAWTPRAQQPGAVQATAQVANLYFAAPAHAAARRVLDAEVVALIETIESDREALRADPRWPHQHWMVPHGHGGMALLSRWPMRAREAMLDQAPMIDARVEVPWGPLRIIAIHTSSPGSQKRSALNRSELARLGDLVRSNDGPLLLLGDLNTTPAGSGFRSLLATGLQQADGGSPASWPWFLGPCGIAIDHALVRGLRLGAPRPVWLPESDHRGLRVAFGP